MAFDFSDPGEKNLTTGIHRICSAQATIDRILPRKHDFGITRLANVTGLDRIGVPVALAFRPNSRSVAVSQGKGMTLEHAKASALMESVEIWHAERFDKPMRFACAGDLIEEDRALIDLARLPKIRDSAFTDATRMLWTAATEMMSGGEVLVPYEMVHTDYTHPPQPGHGCFPSNTNGLASGNHPLEAICHSICEVVERDAIAVWYHSKAPLRRLALSTVDDENCAEIVKRFDAAKLDCDVWDITSDIGVATFMAVIREKEGALGHLGLGSGTHPDSAIALRRALTEAAQTRLNYISGSRDDLGASEYTSAGMNAKLSTFAAKTAGANVEQRFQDVPTRLNDTLKGDLDWLLGRLRAVGIDEVAVVDMTRQSIGIPVMRVIIPGLEAPRDEPTYLPGPRATQEGAT